MSWYTLASIAETQAGITARFAPDTFVMDLDHPVLVVTVVEPENRFAAIETFRRFRDSFFITHSTTPTSFSAVSEEDWEEWTVHGRSIQVMSDAYSAEELLEISKSLQSRLQAESSRGNARARKIEDIERFVRDLIVRAEARRSLSSRSVSAAESQIDVLTRVLNRLTDS